VSINKIMTRIIKPHKEEAIRGWKIIAQLQQTSVG
jgi:hypothetical protein